MLQSAHLWHLLLLPILLLVSAITVDALILPSAFHQQPFTNNRIHHHDNTAQIHSPTNYHGRYKPSCTPTHVQRNRNKSTALFGIPKMFRWLTDQYPNINSRLNEGLGSDKVVDNFYLDMNGIIHPCTHGNNQDEIVVLDETAMFKKIFGYVDRYVISVVCYVTLHIYLLYYKYFVF